VEVLICTQDVGEMVHICLVETRIKTKREKKRIYADKRDILWKEPLHDLEMREKNGVHKHWRLVENIRIKHNWNKYPRRNYYVTARWDVLFCLG
jgi:hypothetical protein